MVKSHSRATSKNTETLDLRRIFWDDLKRVAKETGVDKHFDFKENGAYFSIEHTGKAKNLAEDVRGLVLEPIWHGGMFEDIQIIDMPDFKDTRLNLIETLGYRLSRGGKAWIYAGEVEVEEDDGTLVRKVLPTAIAPKATKKAKPNGNAFASVTFDADTIGQEIQEETLDDYVSEHINQSIYGKIPTFSTLAIPIITMAKKGKQQEGEIGPGPDLSQDESYGTAQAPTTDETIDEIMNKAQAKEIHSDIKQAADDLETGRVTQEDVDAYKSRGVDYDNQVAKSRNPASTLGEGDYDPRTGKELTDEELRRKSQGKILEESEERRIDQAKRAALGMGKTSALVEKMEEATLAEKEQKKSQARDKWILRAGVIGTIGALAAAAMFGSGIVKYEPGDPTDPDPKDPGPDNPNKAIDPAHPDWTYKSDIAPSLNHIPDKAVYTDEKVIIPMHVTDRDIVKYGDKIDRELKFEDSGQIIKSSKGGDDNGSFENTFSEPGNYLLNASATDRAGKVDFQKFWVNSTIRPEPVNEKPEITSVRVTPTAVPGEHKLSVTATDADTGVGGIEVLLDGKTYATINDDRFEKTINENDFEPGNHEISAVAWDEEDANLRSENNPIAVFHANEPPTMDITIKNLGGDEYEFEIHADGKDNPIKNVQITRTDTDEILYLESNDKNEFLRNLRMDFTPDIGDVPLEFYATDGIADVLVNKTINTINDLMAVNVSVVKDSLNHDHWRYNLEYNAIDNDIKSISVINEGLGINHVKNDVNSQKGNLGGDINASKADNGTYTLDVLVKDDLGQEFKSQIDVVVYDHAITSGHVIAATEGNKTVSVNGAAEKDHSDIKDLIVKFGGETFEQKREYNGINARSVQIAEGFDATEIAPQDAYISAEIVNEHGLKEVLFNESLHIDDSLPLLLDAGETNYNPLNDTLKVKSVVAKDNDTLLQGIDYVIRKAGEQNALLSGSLDAADGSFDSKLENATKLIDTTSLANDTYELVLTPKSNGVNGLEQAVQFQVNRSYEINPIFNPDKDAVAGSLAWNETAGKAELTLVGNNTFFKNWEDEYANVDPVFLAAVQANWSSFDRTNPMAAADWLQNQHRIHYGGLFSDSDVYNTTKETFVGIFEAMRDDVLNDGAVAQVDKDKWAHDRLTIRNSHQFRPIVSWARNLIIPLVTYDANGDGILPQGDSNEYEAFFGGFSGGDYATPKGGFTFITEEAEWKANADDPFEPTVWKAFNYFHKTNFTETNFTIDPSVYSALDDQLDDPIGDNYDQLLKLGLMLETWENEAYSDKLKVSYDGQEYTFSV